MSAQARDRKIELWYKRIKDGEIKLPRFQRAEAWDKTRICSLLTTVIRDLPLGVTLILEVGDEEKFISRYLRTAEHKEPFPRVMEHLLDGQQRLTAMWRALHNNYALEKYFLYLPEFDRSNENEDGDDEDGGKGQPSARVINRWEGRRKVAMMRLIPFDLLKPEDIAAAIAKWVDEALAHQKPMPGAGDIEEKYQIYYQARQKLIDTINRYREVLKHYNLPYLSLPASTSKDIALNVFINMNTNSKPLSQYDIIVAEMESVAGKSLHDLQQELDASLPGLKQYEGLSHLILYTSALLQEKAPNRRGIWEMDIPTLLNNWNKMASGLGRMVTLLASQHIYDSQRLPTNAVLSVIAALFANVPSAGDQAGRADTLIKRYLWTSFFTERYEQTAASRAKADYDALHSILRGAKKENGQPYVDIDVPVLNPKLYPLATLEEILQTKWPKNSGIRGRGILAVANLFGALDFADGQGISAAHVKLREYHHIFADAMINEANSFLEPKLQSFLALNCALITNTTNRVIGRKNPLKYLGERYKWSTEAIVHQRLQGHLIPIEALKSAGNYEALTDKAMADKVKADYEAFIVARGNLVMEAVRRLTAGNTITNTEIYAALSLDGEDAATPDSKEV
jgi:hypothetical protein